MYNHQEIEKKWQDRWLDGGLYKTETDRAKPKYYILDMFPYPSGAGLHAGHVESYTATDIYARYYRARGFNVFHPQGFDSFGLPAENYAIKTGISPVETTKKAIETFTKQMNSLGLSYDWEKTVNTSDPAYYKWTQWLFLLMYKNGLAYKKKAQVNWCASCQTVLANEQVVDGHCERCGNEVIQKDLEQWFFKITDFIEDQTYEGRQLKGLLNGLDEIDWPSSTKAAQRNWIGRSVGAEITFKIKGTTEIIKVFTTRVDTIFGCTYVVLAPEHSLVVNLKDKITNWSEVDRYLEMTEVKTNLQRTDLNKDKTGVVLAGLTAVNPFNQEEIKIYLADYVLASYGTGAVMAVPAHDERDLEFAKKYRLPIKIVIVPNDQKTPDRELIFDSAYTAEGILINSGQFTGLTSAAAREEMTKFLINSQQGQAQINYRLRDWLVSRQRYWGAPIPIIYCEQCGEVPVPEESLPVLLPTDVDFRPTGESPLKYSSSFQQVKCPKCGAAARRENDTMDTFVCSSWYYLRYVDCQNSQAIADPDLLKYWLPVDVYMGGAEHAVMHLLYVRFFTKVLQKYGVVSFNEPFLKLRHQGIILGEDGNKMSKSKGNVVNPDELIAGHGADALRLYEMFMGPLEDMKPWSSRGIIGISRFLEKIYNLGENFSGADDQKIVALLHKTIKKVGEDIENFHYNTAISALMIFVNNLGEYKTKNNVWPVSQNNLEKFILILASFAPHLTEELWEKLGHQESIFKSSWPEYDPQLIKDETVNLVISVNGKLRATLEVAADISEVEAIKLAAENETIKKWLEGKEIVKNIFVAGKLLNIVVK
ncbi:MAG: leucine--tRNA ligase [Patescibacteria group bacterium]|jgi:leucyl-tRNA synthetase